MIKQDKITYYVSSYEDDGMGGMIESEKVLDSVTAYVQPLNYFDSNKIDESVVYRVVVKDKVPNEVTKIYYNETAHSILGKPIGTSKYTFLMSEQNV